MQRLDVITLGLLSRRPLTGYDVRKWLDRYGYALGYSAQTSQIYRQLGRFAELGWTSTQADRRSSGPDAKLHRLTDAGRAAFEEWVDSEYVPARRPMDPDLQVRLLFSAHRGPEHLLALVRVELETRRRDHPSGLGRDSPEPVDLAHVESSLGDTGWEPGAHLLLEERGNLLVGTLISWLEATEARLVRVVSSADRASTPRAADSVRIPTPEEIHP